MELKFDDFRIVPDFSSVHREAITDEEYFSDKYSRCLSNSRLRYINPEEGGSPMLFYENPKIISSSLSLGTAIHGSILEPETFELGPKIGKPGNKLGLVLDKIEYLLNSKKEFDTFDELIKYAALDVDYYSSTIDSKIDYIKATWNKYALKVQELKETKEKEQFILADRDWEKAFACIKSIRENKDIMSLIHPINAFGDPIESHCEDALFIDYIITYKREKCSTIRFKLKIDNWTIDYDNKIVTVNDLKTTVGLNKFDGECGSLYHYHYYRQLKCYSDILLAYLQREFGVTRNTGWICKCNICAVETIPNYYSRVFPLKESLLEYGKKEFDQLLKRVAACEIFGYDQEYFFE